MEAEKKLKILFDLCLIHGMINTSIAIAEHLYRRGHRIIFIVNDEWKNTFIPYGFEEILVSQGNSKTQRLNSEYYEIVLNYYLKTRTYDTTLTPYERFKLLEKTLLKTRFEYTKQNSPSLKKIIESVEPNVIITDNYSLPVTPSIVRSECPWVLLISSNPLRNNDDDRLPIGNCGLSLTDRTQWSKCREEYNSIIKPFQNEMNEWLIGEKISPLMDNQIRIESPFLNIYNYPQEIDYCHLRPLTKNWTQFDAFVRTENEEFVMPKDFSEKSGKLIYFTMGTLLSVNVQMMERLIHILSKSSHRFIVSKGPFADRYELPDNMYGERMVPQTKVLPIVDMIIFHGGNNTLVESFYFGKPMIVMPLANDGFDNAQRIVETNFGLKLDPMTCTGDELLNAIEKVLNDEQLMNRMKEVSERIQRDSKSNKLAHAIEDIGK